MLFIGLLIALAAAVFAAVLLAEDWGGATYTIHGFGHVLGSLTLAEIFLSGIIITAIFFMALWLASVSSRLRRRASARRRAEHRAVREDHDNLMAERDRLAGELEAERAGRAPASPADETPAAYPRDTEVYGDRAIDRSDVDPAYRDRVIADEEARGRTV